MKKSYITIIVIVGVLLVAGAVYYFFFYNSGQTVQTTGVQVNQSNVSGDINKSETTDNKDVSNNNTTDSNSNTGNNASADIQNNKSNKSGDKTDITIKDNNETDSNVVKKSNKQSVTNTTENKVSTSNSKEENTQVVDYSYRNEFRNPFLDYHIKSDDNGLTLEAIKEMVPFELKGIIGNEKQRLAVIDYKNKTKIIEGRTQIEDFTIVRINAEELVLTYQGVQFKIEMGSGIGDIQ